MQKRLGKGLDLLIGGPKVGYIELPIEQITSSPHQPRQEFDEALLKGLSESIKSEGLLQPIIVRKEVQGYQLIAGERRLRAARLAGLKNIPAMLIKKEEGPSLITSLIENLQRQDLNPIEKARAFKKAIQILGLTQDQLADSLGLDRSTIANFIRLLDLPKEIQDAVSRGTISMGHARALLGVHDIRLQLNLFKRVLDSRLSVRGLERLVYPRPKKERLLEPIYKEIEERLKLALSTKVSLLVSKRGKGKIVVNFYSDAQLSEILRRLQVVDL
jgi:ParB family chromosome partitioning protein